MNRYNKILYFENKNSSHATMQVSRFLRNPGEIIRSAGRLTTPYPRSKLSIKRWSYFLLLVLLLQQQNNDADADDDDDDVITLCFKQKLMGR
jgi:hypothetical protein